MISLKYYDVIKKDVFPLATSITGDGNKKFLRIIKKHFPKLKIFRVNSGKQVFDWKIPPEWNIKTAYVLDKNKMSRYHKQIDDVENSQFKKRLADLINIFSKKKNSNA